MRWTLEDINKLTFFEKKELIMFINENIKEHNKAMKKNGRK